MMKSILNNLIRRLLTCNDEKHINNPKIKTVDTKSNK